MKRVGYSVELGSGRVVEVVAPSVAEVLAAHRAAGDQVGMRGQTRITRALLGIVLKRVANVPVTATDLVISWPLDAVETDEVLGVIGSLGAPTDAEVLTCRDGATISDDGKIKRWTITLPTAYAAPDGTVGRVVVLEELKYGKVADAVSTADDEGTSRLAGALRASLEGLRQSLVSIDGEDYGVARRSSKWLDEWPLTAAETAAARDVWQTMHLSGRGSRPVVVPTTA